MLFPFFSYLENNGLYWIFPLTSATAWFAMLWAMLIVYLVQGRPQYPTMEHGKVAYISDIGAQELGPLFVTGCAITGLFFFLSLLFMRRHQALPRRLDRILDFLALLFGLLGSVSLVLLTVFDTAVYSNLHRLFLLLFMLGVILSAIFTTLEYRSLGKSFVDHAVLRYSYLAKTVLLVTEGALSIAFIVCLLQKRHTAGAILEWVIAFIFTFYVLTFVFDLRPKAHTRNRLEREVEEGMRRRALKETDTQAGTNMAAREPQESEETFGSGNGGMEVPLPPAVRA
ncbi:Frag1/DRAM/Sfk1 family-domain-containing protein [Kalaharituber pfeilii]|nr:Frag1/DRAM/Sfk1 family-domain-containing protein [Kalaharituber pfeilii]